jgi:cell division protein FtsN
VQLSALNTMAQAEQFAQRFRTRGVDARVDGTSAPYRVRTGYFATRAQATARLAELKRLGMDGFVAELTPLVGTPPH